METKQEGTAEKSIRTYRALADEIQLIKDDADAMRMMYKIYDAYLNEDIDATDYGVLSRMTLKEAREVKRARERAEQQKQKELYSAQELAERYGMSAASIRARIRQGEFGNVVRIGNHALVPRESVLKYEAEHTGPAYKPQQRKTRRGHLAGEI